jgi:uncharacterized protein (TIGR02145 family)
MRKLFTFLVPIAFDVFLTAGVFAQSPEKMSYQAVIRNSSDAIVVNTLVGMQISILQGSAGGTAVYAETQTPTTNENGLVSIEIGNGTVVSGNFAAIDWANGPYFIKTETDPKGGINYTITGTSQLLTVPYALYAKTAETLKGGIIETDPIFTKSPSANITTGEITKLNNLSGINTGDQDLSALATKTALGDSMEQVRSEIPDVSGFLTIEKQNLDNVLTQSNSANNKNITNLANPVNAQDAVTKAYVDSLVAKIEAILESDILKYGFTDKRDGKHYNALKIGNQIWMAENLAYLPVVNKGADGSENAAGSYYYVYGYHGTNVTEAKATTNYAVYGVLYNWTAAMNGATSSQTNPSGVQGACPTGWHLPSDAEWTQLDGYLGGYSVAGGKLKETGTTHWQTPNTGATNESGFSALPGGYRFPNLTFVYVGIYGAWWSSTEYPVSSVENPFNNVWLQCLGYGSREVGLTYMGFYKEYGFSIRCVRD